MVILFPRAVIVTRGKDDNCVSVELTYVMIGFFPIKIVSRVLRSSVGVGSAVASSLGFCYTD